MSRCFPFPPPGYMRNGACSEALIKSIKLQKEREEANEERKKENKRKKEEKRKERKVRKEKERNASHDGDGKGKESKLNKVKSHQLEKIRVEQGSGCLQKEEDDEIEQLERSVITEEHDQPVPSQEPYCLSDSTQSSNKRKSSTTESSNNHGTSVRIRLPLRKHREPEDSQQDQLGSNSGSIGIADSLNQEASQLQCITNAETFQCLGNFGSEYCKELRGLIQGSSGVDNITNLIDSESRRMAPVYSPLFQNWVPHQFMGEGFKLEDQEWLFPSELREEKPVHKKVKSVNDGCRCSSPTPWPRAQYIPDADIYALPYAVPF